MGSWVSPLGALHLLGSGRSPSAVPVQAVRVAAAAGARRKRRSCDTGRARSLASLAEEAARSPVFVLQSVLGFSRQDLTLPGPPLFLFLLFFLFQPGFFFLVRFPWDVYAGWGSSSIDLRWLYWLSFAILLFIPNFALKLDFGYTAPAGLKNVPATCQSGAGLLFLKYAHPRYRPRQDGGGPRIQHGHLTFWKSLQLAPVRHPAGVPVWFGRSGEGVQSLKGFCREFPCKFF